MDGKLFPNLLDKARMLTMVELTQIGEFDGESACRVESMQKKKILVGLNKQLSHSKSWSRFILETNFKNDLLTEVKYN